MEDVSYKEVVESDLPFLAEVYKSTRLKEMEKTGWDAQQIDTFLMMQFNAQHQFYKEQFPEANFWIVEYQGQRVGRIYLDIRDDEIRIVDVALLPEIRNQGLGSGLLNKVIEQAEIQLKAVRIHVEKQNPALRLYQRLGFERIEDKGVYWLMEKPAPLSMKTG